MQKESVIESPDADDIDGRIGDGVGTAMSEKKSDMGPDSKKRRSDGSGPPKKRRKTPALATTATATRPYPPLTSWKRGFFVDEDGLAPRLADRVAKASSSVSSGTDGDETSIHGMPVTLDQTSLLPYIQSSDRPVKKLVFKLSKPSKPALTKLAKQVQQSSSEMNSNEKEGGKPALSMATIPEDDELLLKYFALLGPSCLVTTGDSVINASRHIVPNMNPRQLAMRVNATFVNPNQTSVSWSVDDRRRLALLMRISSNEKNPVQFAASRSGIIDRRGTKSISEKWRMIDPMLPSEEVGAWARKGHEKKRRAAKSKSGTNEDEAQAERAEV